MMDRDFYDLVTNGKKHSTDNWGTGVILQHPQTKKILMARRTDGDRPYATPGGKVEYGESPMEGICRECLEESNVAIHDMKCYDFRTHSSANGKNWVDFLFYSDSFDDSDIQNQETEMEPFEWFDVDEAMELNLFPPTRASLESAISLGLLEGNCHEKDYIPFVDCPTSGFAAKDSCINAYSYQEPEQVFTTHQFLEWD